jgi:hypothetical protein
VASSHASGVDDYIEKRTDGEDEHEGMLEPP